MFRAAKRMMLAKTSRIPVRAAAEMYVVQPAPFLSVGEDGDRMTDALILSRSVVGESRLTAAHPYGRRRLGTMDAKH